MLFVACNRANKNDETRSWERDSWPLHELMSGDWRSDSPLALPGHEAEGPKVVQRLAASHPGAAGQVSAHAPADPPIGKRQTARTQIPASHCHGSVPAHDKEERRRWQRRMFAEEGRASITNLALEGQTEVASADRGRAKLAATAGGAPDFAPVRATEVSTTRLAAAFAKRDATRQGKLAPTDFAAAVRLHACHPP